MDKNYDAVNIEKKWQKYWDKEGIYSFDKKSKKPVFSIDVPPPYASAGHLHIGHALHYTQFEIIARIKRMQGYNVYFAPCFDNNGLPTEKYVEEKYKINKSKTNRADFRKLCREESKKVEEIYSDKVFKKLGHSYDWSLLYTTIDTEAQKVAQMSFIDLYEKKLAYRSHEPGLFCCYHQTALAQAEVENKERETKLNYIYFDLKGGGKIEIATTRPEFLGSCVAVFVNPNDKRYKKLIGQKIIVPLYNKKVEIKADDQVDMEFGSGIVMVCTFGDSTDIEWWKKHKLPLIVLVNHDGTLNENGGKYKGMRLEEARKEILNDLEKENKLIKQEVIKQNVGTCWRCGNPIEFIPSKQWFVKLLDNKDKLIKQGKKIRWIPEFYFKRYEDWVNNLAWDWCISRQRFYGVPIPVWYCDKCGKEKLADKKVLPIDPIETKPKGKCGCGNNKFIADEDVFDTWMTSSMTPQIALRWLENPKEYEKKFPVSLRPQSHDIIRTWAFYTITKSYYHFNEIPWKDILLGTFVLDPSGRGMHKSKGNAIWADDILKKYDVDTLRYWVGTAYFGEDLAFKENDLVAGKKFITKLWNASKFVFMSLEDYTLREVESEEMDKWLISKLNEVIKGVNKDLETYNIASAKRRIEQFFWHTFCDDYLEIVKDRLYNPDRRGKLARESAQYTLYNSLLTILKLIAPIMPHITEEIYQNYYAEKEKCKSIHISKWPEYNNKLKVNKIWDEFVEIISKVRQFKSDNNKSLKTEIILTIEKIDKGVLDDLMAVTKAKEIKKGKFKIELAE